MRSLFRLTLDHAEGSWGLERHLCRMVEFFPSEPPGPSGPPYLLGVQACEPPGLRNSCPPWSSELVTFGSIWAFVIQSGYGRRCPNYGGSAWVAPLDLDQPTQRFPRSVSCRLASQRGFRRVRRYSCRWIRSFKQPDGSVRHPMREEGQSSFPHVGAAVSLPYVRNFVIRRLELRASQPAPFGTGQHMLIRVVSPRGAELRGERATPTEEGAPPNHS